MNHPESDCAKLYHPCRDVCSEYKQGFDAGYLEFKRKSLESISSQRRVYLEQIEGADGDMFGQLDFAIGAMDYIYKKISRLGKEGE